MRQRFEADGYKPHWAQLWPAAVMLADHVIRGMKPTDETVLELGAGLGVVGVAMAQAGHRVVVTDYDEDALAFTRANAVINEVQLHEVRLLDWRDPPMERFAMIVAADVLYDRRNHQPIATLLATCLKSGGSALLSDLNRSAADGFPDALRAVGLTCCSVPAKAKAIPNPDAIDERILNGRIFRISK